MWNSLISGFGIAKPFLAAAVLIALLVLVGDRGGRAAIRRNNPCLGHRHGIMVPYP